jgi:ethanolamine ammonia-lyase large subunit
VVFTSVSGTESVQGAFGIDISELLEDKQEIGREWEYLWTRSYFCEVKVSLLTPAEVP